MFSHLMQASGNPASLDPLAAAGLGLAAGLCIFGPVLLGFWWHRRTGAAWGAFGAGTLVFFVAQIILRLPWQVPLGRWVAERPQWFVPFLIFSSFTAAIFEEAGRWLGYRKLLRERSRRIAVMFGLGHGALEAALLVGLPLAGLLVSWSLASRGSLPPEAISTVSRRTASITFWNAQIAVLERASAIALHVGLSLIVLQAFSRNAFRWVVVAMACHFLANLLAVTLINIMRVDPLLAEAFIASIAGAVLIAGWRVTKHGVGATS